MARGFLQSAGFADIKSNKYLEEERLVMNLSSIAESGQLANYQSQIMNICKLEENISPTDPNAGKFKITPSTESLLAKKKDKNAKNPNEKGNCSVM